MCVVRVKNTPLCLCAAGSESVSQSFYEAMNVGEGVVQRHRSDPQHAGLPHVTLNKDKHQKLLMQITPRFKLMLWIFPVQKHSRRLPSSPSPGRRSWWGRRSRATAGSPSAAGRRAWWCARELCAAGRRPHGNNAGSETPGTPSGGGTSCAAPACSSCWTPGEKGKLWPG